MEVQRYHITPVSHKHLEVLYTLVGRRVEEHTFLIYKNRLRKRLMALTLQLGFGEVTQIHALRHTFASHLVMKGVDLATVKKLMGHSDIDTTMIYSHLTEKHVDSAVEKLAFR